MDNKLQQLSQSFHEWRGGRKYPGGVPNILKCQVLEQLAYFSDNDIAIATGLSKATVVSWRKGNTKKLVANYEKLPAEENHEQQFISIADNAPQECQHHELKISLPHGIDLQVINFPIENIVQLLNLLIKQEVI